MFVADTLLEYDERWCHGSAEHEFARVVGTHQHVCPADTHDTGGHDTILEKAGERHWTGLRRRAGACGQWLQGALGRVAEFVAQRCWCEDFLLRSMCFHSILYVLHQQWVEPPAKWACPGNGDGGVLSPGRSSTFQAGSVCSHAILP